MELLHDADTLLGLCRDENPIVADWARTMLCLYFPEQSAGLPSRLNRDLVAFVGPDGLAAWAAEDLRNGGDPLLVTAMGAAGTLPEDCAPIAHALRASRTGADDDWWRYSALHEIRALHRDELKDAYGLAGEDRQRQGVLAAMALQLAGPGDGTLEEVAAGLHELADGEVLNWTLSALWAHVTNLDIPSPEAAIELGCIVAGVSPHFPSTSGSRHRRIRQAILDFVEGVEHPAARLLAAVYREKSPRDVGVRPLFTAAWLGSCAFDDSDPWTAVRTGRDADPVCVSAARRTRATASPEPGDDPLFWADRDPAAVVRALEEPVTPDRTAAVGRLAAEQVPELIGREELWPAAFDAAAWVPSAEVLAALLAVPMPRKQGDRERLAMALALKGDRLVRPLLVELVGPEHPAREVADALLGGDA